MATLRKSHSNFIIRKKRQSTGRGSIYERDWMTVSELNGFAPGSAPVYSSGNFKMTINAERNSKKKYSFSNWVINDSGSTEWNGSMLNESELKVKKNLIKPNYSSILDFACYGSATQLIYGTISNIYKNYPGEMYGTDKKLRYYNGGSWNETSGYYVENPFDIDVHSDYVKPNSVENQLRYMVLSWDKYEFFIDDDPDSVYGIKGWYPGEINSGYCYNGDIVFSNAQIITEKCDSEEEDIEHERKEGGFSGGSIDIPLGNDSENYAPKIQTITHGVHEYNFAYGDHGWIGLDRNPEPISSCTTICFSGVFINGKVYLTSDKTGWHVRPKKKYANECFENIDDFGKVLLNRESKPIFKSKFYTPRETDSGVVINERAYVWPLLSGGWNIDMESDSYASYLNSLLYIATFYDESRSDNIWRSYTHESIKNFDWTTPKDTYVPEMDGHEIDTERMEAILKVCGRQFDDIKRYIENIKFSVNVSYDSKNNMPDSSLSKFLEMSGWDVKNVSPSKDDSLEVIDDYPGVTVKSTPEQMNNEFIKRLILNSRNILSKKGTRAGIEAVYSMFGIFDKRYGYEDDSGHTIGFEMDEYDVMSNNYIYGEDYEKISSMNQQKDNYQSVVGNEYHASDLNGLMCDHKIDIDDIHYIVPWYDIDSVYDGNPYFQMMGGWGKRYRKKINLPEISSGTTEIFSDSASTLFNIYDETVKNLKVADSFKSLNETPEYMLNNGDVFYVVDMKEAYTTYGCEESSENTHYVIFFKSGAGIDLPSDFVPYNDEYAWYIISVSDINEPESSMKWYAKKILYLESIHDVNVGNNPHNGNGMYDGGKEFFEFYKEIFKGAIDGNMFSQYKMRTAQENSRRHYENRFRTQKLPDLDDKTEELTGIGFDITDPQKDNEKIWYFLSYDNGIYNEAYNEEDLPDPEIGVANIMHSREFGEEDYKLVTNADYLLKTEGRETQDAPIWNGDKKIVFDEATLEIPDAVKNYYSKDYQPDETSSYSVINTKNLKITYHLPWELEDYVTDVVEFYVKQMIPSTVIVEFAWDYTDGPRPPETPQYSIINLSPSYRSIRSNVSSAEINIGSIGTGNIGIEEENTTKR